jgi:hypothetical protein
VLLLTTDKRLVLVTKFVIIKTYPRSAVNTPPKVGGGWLSAESLHYVRGLVYVGDSAFCIQRRRQTAGCAVAFVSRPSYSNLNTKASCVPLHCTVCGLLLGASSVCVIEITICLRDNTLIAVEPLT